VYLRQTEGQPHGEWDKLPVALLNDAAQLVKANSIEGNKKDNITVGIPSLHRTEIRTDFRSFIPLSQI